MIQYNKSPYSRRHNVTVTAAHHMTVDQVIAFADELRRTGAPLDTQLNCNRDYNSGHFIGMTASWTEELPKEQA